jgi:hypothetical protein
MAIKIETVEAGTIALIQQTETGRILQIAITAEQSEVLQMFLASISQTNPLIQMGEDHDLVLKRNLCKGCKSKFS